METKTEEQAVRSLWHEVGRRFANWSFATDDGTRLVWSEKEPKLTGCKEIGNLQYVQVMLQSSIVKQIEDLTGAVLKLTEVVQEELATVRRQNAALDHKDRDRLIAVLERLYALKSIP